MAFDRSKWTATLTTTSSPAWPCPSCAGGVLAPVTPSFFTRETAASRDARGHDAWEPEWMRERFAGELRCMRTDCAETVAVCGDVRYGPEYDPEHGQHWVGSLYPAFFHPPLPLFQVPSECPGDIEEELKRAWALYWSDTAACANRVRASVELLLTREGIPRFTKTTKGKRVRLSLHDRIVKYEGREPELGQALMAVKWIGNTGSHESVLHREDVLDGLELLEHVLVEVIEQRSKRLARLGKQIVRRKGPRSQRTRT